MDVESVVEEIRTVVRGQLRVASEDPAVLAAADAVLLALDPALRQAVSGLAEQAAVEVAAQLPGQSVDVVLRDGQPTLIVRGVESNVTVNTEHLNSRITVRLPEELKDELDVLASELGDSVNTFVVRALAGSADAKRRSSHSTFKGTIET